GGRQRKETACVADRQSPLGDQLLYIRRKLQEPDQVCDGRSVLARAAAHLFLIQLQFAAQAVERLCGFDRVQILPLNILDQRDLQQLLIGDFLNDCGYPGHASDFGGSPAAFTGNELIPFRPPPDDERLYDTVGANGLSQLLDAIMLKDAPGLQWIGVDQLDGELRDLFPEMSWFDRGLRRGPGRQKRA